MTPEVILRELAQIQIGDIQLETTDGRQLVLAPRGAPEGEAKTHPGGPGPGAAGTIESRPPFVVKTVSSKYSKPQCF